MIGSLGRRWALPWVMAALAACAGDDEAPVPVPRDLQVVSATAVELGQPVVLRSSLGGDLNGLSVEWTFGDGQSSTQAEPTHVFAQPGDHVVTLSVRNAAGEQAQARTTVRSGHYAMVAGRQCSQSRDSGWCWQSPLPFASDVRAVSFADARHAWASGEAGALWRTVDGGLSWQRLAAPMPEGIRLLRFLDARTGWAVGYHSTRLMRTADGGVSWQAIGEVPMGRVDTLEVLEGGATLVASGMLAPLTPTTAVSPDGGRSWRPSQIVSPVVGSHGALWGWDASGLRVSRDRGLGSELALGWGPAGAIVQAMALGDDTNLRVLADVPVEPGKWDTTYRRQHFHSADGGRTWTATPVVWPAEVAGWGLMSAVLLPGGQGWASVAEPSVIQPIDGKGASVGDTKVVPPAPATPRRRLLRTDDGGRHWVLHTVPGVWFDDAELPRDSGVMLDDRTVMLRVSHAQALLSVDAGTSWRGLDVPGESEAPVLLRREPGGVLVAGFGSAPRRVHVSLDNGQRWTALPGVVAGPAQVSIGSLWFLDARRGFALGQNGALLDTDDGGRSWVPRAAQERTAWSYARELGFTPDGTGWMVTGGQLRRSTDRGQTWRAVTFSAPLNGDVRAAQFVDDRHGWAVLQDCSREGGLVWCSQRLASTLDGGQQWADLGEFVGASDYERVRFADTLLGLSARWDGSIWRTVDGGARWQQVRAADDRVGGIRALSFTDTRRAWLLRESRHEPLLRSVDGGLTWQAVVLPAGLPTLNAVHFVDARIGWIVGDRGLVLRTDDGGTTWVAQDSGTEHSLFAVFAKDTATAWVAGTGGVILATATGGR
ncbi:MAG: PKD domain-containing protein [Burkholderiales bacterium]|nr:PKD domain-containing protein [Burkholderiales bacterium]